MNNSLQRVEKGWINRELKQSVGDDDELKKNGKKKLQKMSSTFLNSLKVFNRLRKFRIGMKF